MAILGVLLAGMLMVIAPGVASACSCMNEPLANQLATAEVVFTGTPTMGDTPEPVDGVISSAAQVRWAFDVDAVQKSTVDRTVDVLSALDSASCGVPFVVDQRYLVLGALDGEEIVAGLCGGSVRFDQIPVDDLAWLGKAAAPAANTQSTSGENTQSASGENTAEAAEASNNSWSSPMLVVGAIALVSITGFGLAVVRRRSRPNP